MGVPSSGELKLSGIFNEVEVSNYSSTKMPGNVSLVDCSDGTQSDINQTQLPHNRPDESAPHAMSEFYNYDQNADYPGFFGDDWEDGDIGDGSRTDFHDLGHELAESGDLDSSELDVSIVDNSNGFLSPGTFDDRPAWTHSPSNPSLDTDNDVRFTNTNSPQGNWLKSTWSSMNWAGALTTATQAFAYRWRFFMNSTNNKDGIIDVRMNTTNHPNPGISTQTYQIQVRDNADPQTGAVRLARRSSTTVTTLSTSPSGAYTIGTTMDFVFSVHESQAFGNARTLKVGVGPTTVSTPAIINSYNKISVVDTNYVTNYGWNFRSPKAMSTPSSTHYHKYSFIYTTVVTV